MPRHMLQPVILTAIVDEDERLWWCRLLLHDELKDDRGARFKRYVNNIAGNSQDPLQRNTRHSRQSHRERHAPDGSLRFVPFLTATARPQSSESVGVRC